MESTLYLMKNVDLDPNYNYTIDFDTPHAQSVYFDSKISNALEYNEEYSQIKFDEPIKVYQNIDELFGVNYLMFENHNKTYYAFILNKKWVSDTCTALEFKIDVMQTFMFDYEIDETFIDREHQDRYNNELKPIYNIESEQLERGEEYEVINEYKIDPPNKKVNNTIGTNATSDRLNYHRSIFWLSVVASEQILDFNLGANTTSITCTNNVPTNIYYYIAPIELYDIDIVSDTMALASNYTQVFNYADMPKMPNNELLTRLSQDPRVISMSISRYTSWAYSIRNDKSDEYIMALHDEDVDSSVSSYYEVGKYKIDDYTSSRGLFYITNTPAYAIDKKFHTAKLTAISKLNKTPILNINNLKNIENETKLLTRDYHYYSLKNKDAMYYHENFDDEIAFSFYETNSIRDTKYLLPINYNNEEENLKNSLKEDSVMNELPLRTDAWLNYLLQHKSSMVSGLVTSGIQTIAGIGIGIATGGIGLAVAGGQALNFAGQIANQMAQIKDLKNTPDQVKVPTNDIIAMDIFTNLFYVLTEFSIKKQFKNKIFNYFYHYGYKCNDFKKPNLRSRYYFNYIKTIGANIKTNIDANYKDEIMRIFDAGITIWHYRNADTFKGVNNYDYENVEMNLMEVNNG